MPIVLMQRAWSDEPRYKDTEFVVYHYPQQYFDQIRGGERFVYYRPSRGAARNEASCYFGCGQLGDWWDDRDEPGHRFVGIRQPVHFGVPVPHVDLAGRMYESTFSSRSAFQGHSVRHINDVDYYRILIAAGLTGNLMETMPTVDDVASGLVLQQLSVSEPPKDAFRELTVVPDGTGYRPTGTPVNVFESAALQERARADHQDTLKELKRLAEARGATCLYNNHVDLLATFGDRRLLVEAKSLVQRSAVVDRMRYGMGQLFDYSVRYRAEIGKAEPVLAFASPPPDEGSWIAKILEENGVAFVARHRGALMPLNERARGLPFFA
ncbi:MAG TPA: hypothetical protein VNF68_05490 [Candidatus Baltobacteraceae bacterium]|nr:hypothetical protein [Candidatus Baltobacteraceae bacterium]